MSKLTATHRILQHGSDAILVLSFEGKYPPGSDGNECAAEMVTYTGSILTATNASAILFDFQKLRYTWGDAICGLAMILAKEGVFRPSAIVADGRTARALEPLLGPRWVFGIAGTKMFRNMNEGIVYLESKLTSKTG